MACNCSGSQKTSGDDGNEKEYLCKCCDDKNIGTFGLAWVATYPNCPYKEPLGWQVQFSGTAIEVESKCKKIIDWVNAPPLTDTKVSNLKNEMPDNTKKCSCCPQQNTNNNYNDQYQNDYYADYSGNGCCTCGRNRDTCCAKCKRCVIQPDAQCKLDFTPPDIIKLCPPRNNKDNNCPCTCGINNFMSVKTVNCDPKCPQGILRKCKSHPVTKRCITCRDLRDNAQDNGCQCNTIRSEAYINESPLKETKTTSYNYVGTLQQSDNRITSTLTTDMIMTDNYNSANDVEIVSLNDN